VFRESELMLVLGACSHLERHSSTIVRTKTITAMDAMISSVESDVKFIGRSFVKFF
jgi:hypothetical protein